MPFSNFAVQFTNVNFAQIAGSSVDLFITEGAPLAPGGGFPAITDAQVAQLIAQGRSVVGYVNLAVTDDARYYWNAAWTSNGQDTGTPTAAAPGWLQGAIPLNFDGVPGTDALMVKFWDPAWQQIVIDQCIALVQRGYSGVFLDDLGTYFVNGPGDEASIRLRATLMAEFVITIGNAIRQINPAAIVVVNADPYLTTNVSLDPRGTAAASGYLQAVDAFLLENQSAAALDYAQTSLAGETRLILESDGSPAYSFLDSWQRGILYTDFNSGYSAFGSNAYPVTEGADTVFGGNGPNAIFGLGGNDQLHGLDGNDTLDGGSGINSLFGGNGNDRLLLAAAGSGSNIDGGAGLDTLAVSGAASVGSLTGIEQVELAAGGVLTLTGHQFASGLASTAAISGSGAITVNMSAGSDFLATQLTVASTITLTVNGTSGLDVIKGALSAAMIVNAGDGGDQIRTSNLVDTIDAGAGNDKIMGLGGADLLTGGAGSDQFRYLFAGDSGLGGGADRILDFTNGQDKLDFRALDANPALAGRQALTFIGSAAFVANGTAQVRYGDVGADTRVEVDLNGDGAADMQILLIGHAGQALSGADFLL